VTERGERGGGLGRFPRNRSSRTIALTGGVKVLGETAQGSVGSKASENEFMGATTDARGKGKKSQGKEVPNPRTRGRFYRHLERRSSTSEDRFSGGGGGVRPEGKDKARAVHSTQKGKSDPTVKRGRETFF